MAVIHEPDAYTHIFDNRNAIDEYFKLKHRLALTDKERFNLYQINPNTTIDIHSSRILPEGITGDSTLLQLVEGLKFYKKQNNLKVEDLAAELGISRVNIYNFLNGKRKRLRAITRFKIVKMLGG